MNLRNQAKLIGFIQAIIDISKKGESSIQYLSGLDISVICARIFVERTVINCSALIISIESEMA